MTGIVLALARLAGEAAGAYIAEYRKALAPPAKTELSCTGARIESAWAPTHQATMPARSFGFIIKDPAQALPVPEGGDT